jgi:hypothetical protein
MTVLACPGSLCTRCHTAEWTWWLCTSFYLGSRIWPYAILQLMRQRNSECASKNFVSLQWCNLLVQGFHCWQGLDLLLWPWDKATILPIEKSKFTETEKREIGKGQSQEHAHHFLWHQGDCSQRVCPGMPNSQFRIPRRCFMAAADKCVKISPRALVTKELAVTSTTHLLILPFLQGNSWPNQHDCHPPPTLLTSLDPLTFLFPQFKITLKGI